MMIALVRILQKLPKPLLIKYEAFMKKIIGNDHTQNGSKSSVAQNLILIFFSPLKSSLPTTRHMGFHLFHKCHGPQHRT